MLRFRTIVVFSTLIALLTLTGCQAAAPAAPRLETSGAWGRSSPMVDKAGAVYVVIENKGNVADRLISASSPAAKMVEVHESYMEGGMMKMRPVAGLDVPAGGKVELKPGSYHIMLIDLVAPLQTGSTIVVTLKFEKSGEVAVNAEIREQ
jgi:periplasmic copper chaperone A